MSALYATIRAKGDKTRNMSKIEQRHAQYLCKNRERNLSMGHNGNPMICREGNSSAHIGMNGCFGRAQK